jgi:hypothetical protein
MSGARETAPPLPDGLVAVVKEECPTCRLVVPVLARLAGERLTVYTQDDPGFPAGVAGVADDTGLAASWRLGIEIVPTLVRIEDGREAGRAIGWNRDEWRALTGIDDLGADLPENRPGCGSRTVEPGMANRLKVRFGETGLASRRIPVPDEIEPVEYCYERGWTDGLPVVPPTQERVLEMLEGTRRDPAEIVGLMPPNRVECSIEKIAINAVMAGCRPPYLPVVIAAVEAALIPEFGLHGVVATTNAVAPVVMVSGPMARAIGMNAKGNALGQGNRANATIGRALQLVVRNVGGGRPGEIDRAVFGNPGKYTFCFAEDEDPEWESYAAERGFPPGASTVTLFTGDGVTPIIDHISRDASDLADSYAGCLRALYHPGQVNDVSAFLIVAGEHAAVFHAAGWSKARLKDELHARLQVPLAEVVSGRAGRGPFSPDELSAATVPKFRTGSLNVARAGGSAGKYTACISGLGSITINPVVKEITR